MLITVPWTLQGIVQSNETVIIVHSSQGQLVNWNGLRLHIHEGSLPEGINQCTIYIITSLAGEYEIPENSSLVSAIFWLRCEPRCIFTKLVTVEINQCSFRKDPSRLKIVRAVCSQEQLPYDFKLLGGRFDAHTICVSGVVEINGFSGFGVVEEGPASERLYFSQLFYRSHADRQQPYNIHIVYTWNTVAHINVSNIHLVDYFISDFIVHMYYNIIIYNFEQIR